MKAKRQPKPTARMAAYHASVVRANERREALQKERAFWAKSALSHNAAMGLLTPKTLAAYKTDQAAEQAQAASPEPEAIVPRRLFVDDLSQLALGVSQHEEAKTKILDDLMARLGLKKDASEADLQKKHDVDTDSDSATTASDRTPQLSDEAVWAGWTSSEDESEDAYEECTSDGEYISDSDMSDVSDAGNDDAPSNAQSPSSPSDVRFVSGPLDVHTHFDTEKGAAFLRSPLLPRKTDSTALASMGVFGALNSRMNATQPETPSRGIEIMVPVS